MAPALTNALLSGPTKVPGLAFCLFIRPPGGNQIGHAYAHGKINAISVNGQPLLSNITYEPHGPVSGWTWSSGLPHVRAFGLDGEMQRIESAVATTYAYDAGGRMTGQHLWSQLLPAQDDTQNQYTLDLAGRLTASSSTVSPAAPAAASTLALAYAYDANGNRLGLSRNGIQGSYAYSANRLTAQSGGYSQNYQYDGAGRMTADGLHTYTYNGLGRLATVSGGSGILAGYRYNAFGQRVAKDSAGGNVRFVYDEAGHLLGEYTDNGALIQELVWLEDLPVASLRPKTSGTGYDTFLIHPDHLGTPRQITDSVNRMVWRWDNADPFGANYPEEDPDGDGVRFEFNLRFPGQYYDKETGRHYNYFRDYDPGTGRYPTSDPIGLDGGANRYAYAGGNPVLNADPSGLDYWVEGSVEGEGGHPFHRSVCVGQYNGNRICISFGVAEDNCLFGCKGEVYVDTSAPGPIVQGTYTYWYRYTYPSTDAKIAAQLASMVGKPGSYWLIGNSCRNFSGQVFQNLTKQFGGQAKQKP